MVLFIKVQYFPVLNNFIQSKPKKGPKIFACGSLFPPLSSINISFGGSAPPPFKMASYVPDFNYQLCTPTIDEKSYQ